MSKAKITSSLVSVQWLAEHLNDDNLVILDASMKPVFAGTRDSSLETPACIKGARRFDFDNDIRDKNTDLPHMMPSPEFFTQEMQKLGLHQDSAIVVYDRMGVFSSPRAWWMFRAMGHAQVAVLDGGLPAWEKAGYPLEKKEPEKFTRQRGDFVTRSHPELFTNSDQVLEAIFDPRYAVIDARSEGRFKGIDPEPRAGLRGGHIPNSINLPYASVVVDGFLLPAPQLDSIFSNIIHKDQKLIFSCGSGVTACIDALAAELAGYSNLSVYDGSWSEWGLPSSGLPVKTG
jgi:thiosulfate/3-mercaptopyruvate sulfurtransferase